MKIQWLQNLYIFQGPLSGGGFWMTTSSKSKDNLK